MTNDERNAMTPLELAVWASAFVDYRRNGGSTARPLVDVADETVMQLRQMLALHHKREREEHLLARHRIRLLSRDGSAYHACSCSCGYKPPPGTDAEEMMTLHLAHVGGDVLSAVPAIPKPGECP